MKTIYLYLLNTLADWEVGLSIAELNSQRLFTAPENLQIKTFALTKDPIVTMGGITILPDLEITEVNIKDAAMLILPGAEVWPEPEHHTVIGYAKDFLKAGIPVAAICGATEAMARAGILNNLSHTSNGLELLKMAWPEYKGESNYKNELAVTDGNLITAGSSSSVDFAYHILKKLDVVKPEKLDHWYGYFENHSIEEIMKLAGENK